MVVFGGTSGVSTEIAKHLRAIYEEHGDQITAPIVVQVAAEPTHALHSHFEWDNDVAAHHHRLAQARQLIRSCKIVFKGADGVERKVNEYQSVIIRDPANRRGTVSGEQQIRVYRATEAVAKDVAARDALLRQFKLEWTAFRNRWENFEAFIALFPPK